MGDGDSGHILPCRSKVLLAEKHDRLLENFIPEVRAVVLIWSGECFVLSVNIKGHMLWPHHADLQDLSPYKQDTRRLFGVSTTLFADVAIWQSDDSCFVGTIGSC